MSLVLKIIILIKIILQLIAENHFKTHCSIPLFTFKYCSSIVSLSITIHTPPILIFISSFTGILNIWRI
ncbi:hypothetical protein BSPA14S_H0045 (plasmid) [Borreliella spielmanii A14S]|uniref:Uncharacterized protein n=1 Tax=Borreliella spielmanii A14S TaxID=498742 RepID=C0RCH1_9SPIR|nr:hypothetical protein BSPA14S_H0045 [Borreliella spielmanii A14S]